MPQIFIAPSKHRGRRGRNRVMARNCSEVNTCITDHDHVDIDPSRGMFLVWIAYTSCGPVEGKSSWGDCCLLGHEIVGSKVTARPGHKTSIPAVGKLEPWLPQPQQTRQAGITSVAGREISVLLSLLTIPSSTSRTGPYAWWSTGQRSSYTPGYQPATALSSGTCFKCLSQVQAPTQPVTGFRSSN